MKDKHINDDQLTPFSGELEIEDLEFLSEEHHEMVTGGGLNFGINSTLSVPSLIGKIEFKLGLLRSSLLNLFD